MATLGPLDEVMKEAIDALPGIDLPVLEVTKRLQEMWQGEGGSASPSEFRASQMNVVLHFGWAVSAEEAQQRFESLIQFAQRYPCRIIVLCPSRELSGGAMRAKLFSQCYIGHSYREMCCCEALILAYEPENCGHLGNQVSIWLESDLPTYHWFDRVPAKRIGHYFDSLLVGVRRIIYDSSVEQDGDAMERLDWPKGGEVVDLAEARTLPVRQAIGQYLSGFPVEEICRSLNLIRVQYCAGWTGEGRRLLEWIKSCLSECEQGKDDAALEAKYELSPCRDDSCLLTLEFSYEDGRYFRWKVLSDQKTARIESSLGRSKELVTAQVEALAPEQAIAEALFF